MRQDLQVWIGLDHGVLVANAGVLRQAQWKQKAYVDQKHPWHFYTLRGHPPYRLHDVSKVSAEAVVSTTPAR